MIFANEMVENSRSKINLIINSLTTQISESDRTKLNAYSQVYQEKCARYQHICPTEETNLPCNTDKYKHPKDNVDAWLSYFSNIFREENSLRDVLLKKSKKKRVKDLDKLNELIYKANVEFRTTREKNWSNYFE
jgi:hypothetical protein